MSLTYLAIVKDSLSSKATVDLSTSYIWLQLVCDYEETEMRKLLVLVMVAFLCFSMFQFVHLVSPSSQSPSNTLGASNTVIQNGGFEQGLTGWADAGDGFLAVSADNP